MCLFFEMEKVKFDQVKHGTNIPLVLSPWQLDLVAERAEILKTDVFYLFLPDSMTCFTRLWLVLPDSMTCFTRLWLVLPDTMTCFTRLYDLFYQTMTCFTRLYDLFYQTLWLVLLDSMTCFTRLYDLFYQTTTCFTRIYDLFYQTLRLVLPDSMTCRSCRDYENVLILSPFHTFISDWQWLVEGRVSWKGWPVSC